MIAGLLDIYQRVTCIFQYFVLVVVIFILEIVVGVLAFIYKSDIEKVLGVELLNGIKKNYPTDADPDTYNLRSGWKFIQTTVSVWRGRWVNGLWVLYPLAPNGCLSLPLPRGDFEMNYLSAGRLAVCYTVIVDTEPLNLSSSVTTVSGNVTAQLSV